MSPEKQKVAIIKACGWSRHTIKSKIGFFKGWRHKENGEFIVSIPEYLSDLNAMHKAEASLTDKQRAKFVMELHFATEGDLTRSLELPFDRTRYIFPVLHATAAQRAEAFLHTIGKWEYDK